MSENNLESPQFRKAEALLGRRDTKMAGHSIPSDVLTRDRASEYEIGTSGSSGVEYLSSRLFNPAFNDLWEIRSRF